MTRTRRIPKEQSDAFLKGLFSHRYVLAHLLKTFVSEFRETDIHAIAHDCLLPRGDSEHIQTDCTDYGGDVRFDLVFHALVPNAKDELDQLTVNLEFQNNLNPGYAIIKRGIYYLASLLIGEKGRLFRGDQYGDLKKVCSLWLLPNSPRRMANSVCRFGIAGELCEGFPESLPENREDYDLIELKTIHLNQAMEPEAGTCLHMLHTLFSSSLSPERRADILEREYFIEFNQEERKMFDMFQYAEENGIEIGMERGKAEGRAEGKAEGRAEGEKNYILKTIGHLIAKGKSMEEIRELLNLTPTQMQEFTASMP